MSRLCKHAAWATPRSVVAGEVAQQLFGQRVGIGAARGGVLNVALPVGGFSEGSKAGLDRLLDDGVQVTLGGVLADALASMPLELAGRTLGPYTLIFVLGSLSRGAVVVFGRRAL